MAIVFLVYAVLPQAVLAIGEVTALGRDGEHAPFRFVPQMLAFPAA